MEIVFLGDSITEGVPGKCYIDEIQEEHPNFTLVNRGKGGDTVSSLFRRVKKMDDLDTFDKVVLFIGVNDTYGKLNGKYKVLKTLRRQKWAKNGDNLILQYKELLDFLVEKNKNLLVIPPLVLGEDVDNKWNKEITGYETRIELLSRQYDEVTYLDVHSEFYEYLEDKRVSDYLPHSLRELLKDTKLKSDVLIDRKSTKRRLFLTLDGVHLNTEGAHIVAKHILKEL